jgi:GNAT superfamily N-acetyltransferase
VAVEIEVSFAAADDVGEIVAVLTEAAAWMAAKQCPVWSASTLTPAFVAPLVAQREFLAARSGGIIAGVCTLSRADPIFWPDDPPGEAAYLHKLAVRRAFAGRAVTPALVEACGGLARSWGRRALRLDCHPLLRGIYGGLGFTYVDTQDVAADDGSILIVDRLQMSL